MTTAVGASPYGLVGEDHVGGEALEQLPETNGPVLADSRPGGEVDAHPCSPLARKLRCAKRSAVDRRREERIAGDVQTVACEPVWVELVGRELRTDELLREIVTAFRNAACLRAEGNHPGRDVGRLPAHTGLRRRQGVRAGGERFVQADDHVEKRVSECRDHT